MTRVVLALVLAVAAFGAAVPATAQEKKNIVETAAEAGSFDTLASLLEQADLVETLQGKGPYTVFAPTDAAFEKVPDATMEQLGNDPEMLRSVLLHHVAKGRLKAARVVKRKSVKTLNGDRVRVRVRGKRVRVGGARVVTPDVVASNGVIHVINRVILPPSR
jgi:uncharacterized surface protein with fasciclin (FAS1) repeats